MDEHGTGMYRLASFAVGRCRQWAVGVNSLHNPTSLPMLHGLLLRSFQILEVRRFAARRQGHASVGIFDAFAGSPLRRLWKLHSLGGLEKKALN